MPDRTRWTENAFMERIADIRRRDPKLYANLSPQVRASLNAYEKSKRQARQDAEARGKDATEK